jgi:hypothetical protein
MGTKGPENSFGKRGHGADHENRCSLLFGKRGHMKIGSQMSNLCILYYLGCMEPGKQQ